MHCNVVPVVRQGGARRSKVWQLPRAAAETTGGVLARAQAAHNPGTVVGLAEVVSQQAQALARPERHPGLGRVQARVRAYKRDSHGAVLRTVTSRLDGSLRAGSIAIPDREQAEPSDMRTRQVPQGAKEVRLVCCSVQPQHSSGLVPRLRARIPPKRLKHCGYITLKVSLLIRSARRNAIVEHRVSKVRQTERRRVRYAQPANQQRAQLVCLCCLKWIFSILASCDAAAVQERRASSPRTEAPQAMRQRQPPAAKRKPAVLRSAPAPTGVTRARRCRAPAASTF